MAKIVFFLDGAGGVTRLSISGGKDMLEDVIRLSETEFSPGKKRGEFVPNGKLYFRNILESHDFYKKGLEGVDDISIELDKELVGFEGIVSALESHLRKAESVEEKKEISALIDHVCLEKWDGSCDGGCGVYVTTSEVIKNLSTLCGKCKAAEEE